MSFFFKWFNSRKIREKITGGTKYFLQGRYDYQTPHAVGTSFFEQLDAEDKQFFTFENSAHSPFMDEPGRFNEVIVQEILKKEE